MLENNLIESLRFVKKLIVWAWKKIECQEKKFLKNLNSIFSWGSRPIGKQRIPFFLTNVNSQEFFFFSKKKSQHQEIEILSLENQP